MSVRKLKQFSDNLGFTGFRLAKTVNKGVVGFHYDTFDVEVLRKVVGKHKKHAPDGRFIFVIEKGTKILRIDTDRQTVILGDGERAYKAIWNSV